MTTPSSRPDTTAQQHADTAREVVRRLSGTGDVPAIDFALDALLAEVERLTAERDEWKRGAISWTEIAGGHKAVADDERSRAEAAEREVKRLTAERDKALASNAVFMSGEAYSRMHDAWHNETERAEAAEALADRRGEALRETLVRIGHGAHCACDVCAPARAALADEGQGQA